MSDRACGLGIGSLVFLTVLAVASGAASQPAFEESFDPATIGPGSVSTVHFTITNTDLINPVSSLAFTDNLPVGVTIADPANASWTCGGTLDAAPGGNAIVFADGVLGVASSCGLSVDVTSSTPGTHTNLTGNLTSSAGNSGTATADLTVATDRPGFTKSFSPSSVFFGERSTLTFTIDNSANPGIAYSLTFTDNLPSGMVVADPANGSISCSGGTLTAPAGGSVVSYGTQFGGLDASVAAGASCTVTVDVIGGAVGPLGNTTGDLTSLNPQFSLRSSGKASATLSVTFEELSLSKSFIGDPVAPGEVVDLEFTVRNLNRRSSANGIAFTDDLDAVLGGLEAIGLPAADSCGQGSVVAGTGFLSLTGGNLGPEESCTLSVSVQVPANAPSGIYENLTSEITATIDGIPVTGNVATDLLSVAPVPMLTKNFVGDPVGAGDDVILRFDVTNSSLTSGATDIAFVDELTTFFPFPLSVVMPAPDFCGAGSSMSLIFLGSERQGLSMTGGSLAAGATCTFDVTLTVPVGVAAGTYVNITEEITATIDGSTVIGNPATDDLLVVEAPSLSKEFTDDPVAPGDTVTLEFTFSHDELAPGDATAISFTDDLDAALSGLSATGLPIADVCGAGSEIDGTTNLVFSGGSLTPGESCSFSVTLNVPGTATAGAHTNTTSDVTATVLGVLATGNGASDDLRIAGLTLSKEFTDDPVLPGSTANLRFTIGNTSPDSEATAIFFTDNFDDVISGLKVASVSPSVDMCGVGSSITLASGNSFMVLQGGNLLAGTSCTFDVSLDVPASAESDTYGSTTSGFSATIDGGTVSFDNATDELTVNSDVLSFAKEFTDDPVAPGGTVNLRFTLDNLSATEAVSDIAFTDDLHAALNGLVAVGLPISACGGTALGSDVIDFSGGSLAAGASCSFDVSLAVPSLVSLGSVATNTTSEVTGTVGGLVVTGGPAIDELQISSVSFSKSFAGTVLVGGDAGLTFTINNVSNSESLTNLSFSDDLESMISGLVATGLPMHDVCGAGSLLSGSSVITLSDASLGPRRTCTFSIDLHVPAGALAGDYVNVTSELLEAGAPVAPPATAELTVEDPRMVVKLLDSGGNGIEGGVVKYYDSGWKPFGTTGATGSTEGVDLDPGTYSFRMTYAGYTQQKSNVDTSQTNPLEFQTVNMVVDFVDSQGNPYNSGDVRYYASGWKDFGTIASGSASKELLPGSYSFRMKYAGFSQQKSSVNIEVTNPLLFETVNMVVNFVDSQGNSYNSGDVRYYASGWKDFGTIVAGSVSKELLGGAYSFRMKYAGFTQQKSNVNISVINPLLFETVNMVVNFIDSQGNPHNSGDVRYYASGWKDFGTIVSGSAGKELLGGAYSFRMKYAGYSQQKSNVNIDATNPLLFETISMVVRLQDAGGAGLEGGEARYYASGWKDFGTTGSDGNTGGFELLGGTYSFRMTNDGLTEQMSGVDISAPANNPLVFEWDGGAGPLSWGGDQISTN